LTDLGQAGETANPAIHMQFCVGTVVAFLQGQEATMKTIKILALVSTLSFGFAGAALANDAAPTRGNVLVEGAATKAVVAGPMIIRAYSAFSGGSLYTVAAVTGTDRDCQAADRSAATPVAADKMASFTVGAGQVACLATSGGRGFELLWKASKDAPAAAPMMLASSR
jgi:hypothetical protein